MEEWRIFLGKNNIYISDNDLGIKPNPGNGSFILEIKDIENLKLNLIVKMKKC